MTVSPHPEVEASCGRLRGTRDGAVRAFLGIPFAAPPVGPLRWKPPQALPRWEGIRDAARVGARCIQHEPYGELEPGNPHKKEDCLFLNIWTPDGADNLPVIFWIHGGEFWAGSGSEPRYNGARLAARSAVIVTINHRLGVFGFLSHPELSAEGERGTSGNYGLLDQVAALAWTRENVAAFGGDPDNITVAGESAGSCSVSFLMASPLARGQFHRAIGQSCAYFMPEPHPMKPLLHAENEQRGVEYLRAAEVATIAELRELPGEQLLVAWMKDMTKRMQPCVDDRILPQVDTVFARGEQAQVPLLCGWNGDEYGFMRAQGDRFDSKAFAARLTGVFGRNTESLIGAYGPLNLETATQMTSDRLMVWPTWKWAQEHSRRAPTYVYQFNRAAPDSPFGATHASELEYVFGALDSKRRQYGPVDRSVSELVGDFWVNFARTGDPNVADLPRWPLYGDDAVVMDIDAISVAHPLRLRGRLDLLELLYREPQFVRR